MAVIAVASSDHGWDVISVPDGQCELSRFEIGKDAGRVQAAQEVELDLPEL